MAYVSKFARAMRVKKYIATARKKRAAARRAARRMPMRSYKVGRMLKGVHSFSRMATTSQTIILSAGSSYSNGAFEYIFSQIAAYTEFSAMFDQYMIRKVDVVFKMHSNPFVNTQVDTGSTGQLSTISFPTLYLVNDPDDSTPLSLNEFKQRPATKRMILKPNSFIRWSCRPAILTQLYRTSTTTGYAPKRYQWIDVSNVDVPHYSTKWGIDYDAATLPSNQTVTVNVELKFHFSCKGVR